MRNVLVVCIWILLVIPLAAYAASYTGSNKICSAKFDWSGCPWPAKNKNTGKVCGKGLPCDAHPTGGVVTSRCNTLNDCKGVKFTNQQGKSQGVGNVKGFLDIVKGVMDIIKGVQPPPGGGGGGGGAQQPPTDSTRCTAYYQVTAPSSDPCAYYVPPTSSSLLTHTDIGAGASNSLLEALGGGSALNVSDELLGAINPPNVSDQLLGVINNTSQPSETSQTQTPTLTSAPTPTATPTGTASGPVTNNLGGQAVSLQAGTQGNIEMTPTRATVVAHARDTEANTEVAGFYGSNTIGGEAPQGLVARMCQSRPWASSIVTYIIPPSFFDGLCAWRGYPVGAPTQPSQQVIVQQVRLSPSTSTTQQASQLAPIAVPEVDIWAVPPRVPLGARTSIFWNTKGVVSCIVSSPDGSFDEHALSGGAATVPISGATTFTISCLTADGKPVTDYVMVNLAI